MKNEKTNPGFDPATVAGYREKMKGRSFLFADPEDNTDEYARFYFVGTWKGKEAIFDAALYTLRLEHESELFEIAEERAVRHFPWYRKLAPGNETVLSPQQEEELGLFLAEMILELEEEDQVKVREHAEVDADHDYGVGLDVGLHVEAVTEEVIEKFVHDFNSGALSLDPTWYSFQGEE